MKRIIFILTIVTVITGCTSKKDVVYFQDIDNFPMERSADYVTTIKKNDLLSIIVSSRNMENVQFLNRSLPSGSVSNQGNTSNGGGAIQNYLVDSDGYIDFPTYGAIEVAGKSKQEIEKMLESKIRELTTDADVTIRIINFKITILGEVNNPGVFEVLDERITIPQALGLAGDLTLYGERKNVLLLRDLNGSQQAVKIDLTSASVILGDYYYLQQNDVLYVEPTKTQVQNSKISTATSIYLSIVSIALTALLFFTN